MAPNVDATQPTPISGRSVARAALAVVLIAAAAIIAFGFDQFAVALALFVVGVIVAPNDWFKGAADEHSTSTESAGGW